MSAKFDACSRVGEAADAAGELPGMSGRSSGREFIQIVVFLPFLMPPIITGLSMLIFFRQIDFDRSLVTIVIGHAVFVLALVYRTVLVRLQSLSRSLVEASYDLGSAACRPSGTCYCPTCRAP